MEVHICISFTISFPKVRIKQLETEIRENGQASFGARNAYSQGEHGEGMSDGTLT